MEEIFTIFAKFDLVNFSATVALFWFFYKRIDKKFDAVDKKFDRVYEEFDKVYLEFDKVYAELRYINNDIKELRTSLNRMEGAFYSKECCILKSETESKKIQ